MSEELKWLYDDLLKRAEHWRTTTEDPHNIGTAVYTALCEMANAVNGAMAAGQNVTPIRAGGFKKPTLTEVKMAGCVADMPEAEVEKFWNFYESKGWMVGKNRMKSWTHALANWKRGWEEKGPQPLKKAWQNEQMSVWELKTIMENKQTLAMGIKNKYAAEVATGSLWSSETHRIKYVGLKKEIKALNEQIARMG